MITFAYFVRVQKAFPSTYRQTKKFLFAATSGKMKIHWIEHISIKKLEIHMKVMDESRLLTKDKDEAMYSSEHHRLASHSSSHSSSNEDCPLVNFLFMK
jgi:hypothetical protein